MNTGTEPLWLHEYFGRERGLMIIGTPESFRALGTQLIAAADSSTDANQAWPHFVVAPPRVGPYKDIPEYDLSFHLRGSAPLEEILPFQRRIWRGDFVALLVALVLIGVVALVKWVATGAI